MVINGSAKSRWIAVAVMTATFMAGVMVGYAAPRLLGREAPVAAAEPPAAAPGARRERTSIFDQLNLTPEQQVRRDSILEKRRREMNAFWEQYGPEMRAIVDSTRAEIDRMLTPEQRVEMEKFRAKRRERGEERERRSEQPDTTGSRTTAH